MSRFSRLCLKSLAMMLCLALTLSTVSLVIAFGLRFHSLEDVGLPRMYITTENGKRIRSKENYLSCKITLSDAGEFSFEDRSAEIRGRGNTSWDFYPKKPYRIKFDKKTSIFGEEKNKSWVLLALYNDFSLTKDRLAFALADSLGTNAFVPSAHYIELYINGFYQGLYLLTDQVDENKGHTAVKAPIYAEDTAVPFLVELDHYALKEGGEGQDYFSIGRDVYAVKYPEVDERASQEQFEYIQSYIEKVDQLCRKSGVTLSELSEYVDVQQFIDYYLIQEFMGQSEINWKSVYMSKSKDGKLVMGPVWDFDWSANGPSVGKTRKEFLDNTRGFRSAGNWFSCLYHNSQEFREAFGQRWEEKRSDLLRVLDEVEREKALIQKAAERDRIRWQWFRLKCDYSTYFDRLITWCRDRAEWFDTEL